MERIVLSLIVGLFVYAVEVVSFLFGDPLCSSHDSVALLQFKHSLNVTGGYFNDEYCHYSSYPKTTSWNSTSMDCCRWDGVSCDSFTGHVIGLNLSCSRLEGTIHPNSSLFQLPHLQTLDLSLNRFSGSQIPLGIGQLVSLTHLNLSHSSSSPRKNSIRNLTLNVSHNYLTSLDHLPWETMMILDLQSNSLTEPLPSPICTSTSLYIINLSYNNLSAEIPNCLFTFFRLNVLDLRANNFHGPIPNEFPKNSTLVHINLSKNQLECPIPTSLVNCKSLRVLVLENNKICDTFPTWLETLQELEVLMLKSNRFYGPIVAF